MRQLVGESILEALFEKQKSYFNTCVKYSTVKERILKLKKLKSWIIEHRKAIREAIYKDFQKPPVEVDLTDIKPILWEIELAVENLKEWTNPRQVGHNFALTGTSAKIIYEPLGVVLILAPWNFPFNLSIGPLVSAIAAGNCSFVKPSELTPNTSLLIEEMLKELFDEKEVKVCTGDHLVAEELLTLPFNHIFFTGSPQVGKKVMKAASVHLSSVTLELGGLNPAIVTSDANIRDTAQKLIYGKLLNGGQSCLSVNYVLVQKDIHEKLTRHLLKAYKKQRPSETIEQRDLARVINAKHYERIKRLIQDAIHAGAEQILGGKENEQENFIAPVILNNVPKTAAVLNEEIFGPVLPIITFEKLDEAISLINSKERPLSLYIFSNSEEKIQKIIKTTSAGTTCINDTTLQFIHPYLPFGGVGHSGMGKAHGYAGFLTFSNARSVMRQRVGLTTFKIVYPPYNKFTRFLVGGIMKYF